jgi:hypothetical protein
VVNTTAAFPVASVVELELAKLPPAPDALQFTVRPLVGTLTPLLVASCAVSVTLVPVVGALLELVTRYLAGTSVGTTGAVGLVGVLELPPPLHASSSNTAVANQRPRFCITVKSPLCGIR